MSTVTNIKIGKRTLAVAERTQGKSQFRCYWINGDVPVLPCDQNLIGKDRAKATTLREANIAKVVAALAAKSVDVEVGDITERMDGKLVPTGYRKLSYATEFNYRGEDYRLVLAWMPTADRQALAPAAPMIKKVQADGRRGAKPRPVISLDDI